MLNFIKKKSESICVGIGLIVLLFFIFMNIFGCAKKEILHPEHEPMKIERPEIHEEAIETIPVKAKAKELKPKLEFKNVYFEFDKTDLTPEAKKNLRQNVMTLKYYPEKTILVEGHTDEIGEIEYNLILGYFRAKKVCDYYVMLGISNKKITFKSYGEGALRNKNHTKEAHERNRRAVTKIYDE